MLVSISACRPTSLFNDCVVQVGRAHSGDGQPHLHALFVEPVLVVVAHQVDFVHLFLQICLPLLAHQQQVVRAVCVAQELERFLDGEQRAVLGVLERGYFVLDGPLLRLLGVQAAPHAAVLVVLLLLDQFGDQIGVNFGLSRKVDDQIGHKLRA